MLVRASSRATRSTSHGTIWLLIVFVSGLLLTGCTRQFFRDRADSDVDRLLSFKSSDERWPLINYWIYPHPLARFADLDNPDSPSMPPDDPGAWFTAPKPQRPSKVGYHEGTGYLELLAQFDSVTRSKESDRESKKIRETAEQEASTRRAYRINLEQALELAIINSREFQAQRETLYLAALPVTNEQFNFLPQFLATQEAIKQWSARESTFGPTNDWRINSEVGVSQQFATGAALLLRLANQTVIDVSSTKAPTISTSSLILDFSQPLLRGGGRQVALEPLTQSERDLLYEVRRFARFNKEFFVQIAGGPGVGAPGGAATLVPGAGGFQVGGIGFGQVRGQATATGFLPTVQRKLNIELQQRNVDDLVELLQFYREFAKGGGLSPLQVDQVEQQLLDARTQLLAQQVAYLDSIELFKIQIGLPTDLPLELDVNVLEALREQLFRFQKLELDARKISEGFTKLQGTEDGTGALRQNLLTLIQTSPLTQGTQFAKNFPDRLYRWKILNSNFVEHASVTGSMLSVLGQVPGLGGPGAFSAIVQASESPRNRQQMLRDILVDRRDDLQDTEKPVPPELDTEIGFARREYEIATLDELLTIYRNRPWLIRTNPRDRQALQDAIFRQIESRFALVFDEARSERTEAFNKLWPDLPPTPLQGNDLLQLNLDEAQDLVGATALENRLDLMNQQAQLVDSWRKVALFANSLLGTFDVRYNATALAPPNMAIGQGLNFDGNNVRHQLIFNTELPLVRRIERNNYRASLIAFQRQRRNLQVIQDLIMLQVRARVRRLQQLATTYKIQQKALLLIYSQVNQSREQLQAPTEPGMNRDTASAAGTATLQLLQAQRGVPQAQNNLYSTWINYLIARMELYRDLELMQIDSRGVWIDDNRSPPPPVSPSQ